MTKTTIRAALSLRQSKLSTEKIPYARPDFSIDNVEVVRNPDPVLKYVAFTDESLWRIMERSELEISEAKEQRIAKLLGDGSEVCVGNSKSPRAYELKEFVIAALKQMSGWHETQKLFCDPIYWGWRPYEIVYRPGLKFNGREYWGIDAIHERLPEKFAFTVDRRLVYVGDSYSDGKILDAPDDKYRWLVGTSGAVSNPYGSGIYTRSYLYWFLKSRFLQMFSQGLERSLGMLKVRQRGGTAQANSQDGIEEILRDVDEIREVLSQHNILVEMSDLSTELLTDVNVVDGWQKALEYCDEKLKRAILSQNLTSKIDSKGSRAAAEVHYDILDLISRTDAPAVGAIVNDQLIPKLIEINFGVVDYDDLPKLRFLSAMPVSIEASKVLYDMGATIDARALARRAHVPVLDEDEIEDKEAIPLSKLLAQEKALETATKFGAMASAQAPGAPPMKPGPSPTKPLDDRNKKKAVADRQRSAGEPDEPSPPVGANAILQEYYREMALRWIEEAGDPFARSPRTEG